MSGYTLIPLYALGLTFLVLVCVFRNRFRRVLKRLVHYLIDLHKRSRRDESGWWGMMVRWAIVGTGTTLVLVGIPLIPLPGPGWLTVFLGLGLLSLEFSWVARLLRFIRDTFLWLLDYVPGAGFVSNFLREQSSRGSGDDFSERSP